MFKFIVTCAAAVASCTGVQSSTAAPCAGAVVTVINGSPLACDVAPPQRLDVRFPGSDGLERETFQRQADDMGCADLAWSTDFDPAGEFVAMGCDY
jgi:hypothetical protein